MRKIMKWLKDEESGQGLVEYGLIIAGIAIVVVGAIAIFGGRLSTFLSGLADSIGI
jgi:pilus assembly protein Flp/PilA